MDRLYICCATDMRSSNQADEPQKDDLTLMIINSVSTSRSRVFWRRPSKIPPSYIRSFLFRSSSPDSSWLVCATEGDHRITGPTDEFVILIQHSPAGWLNSEQGGGKSLRESERKWVRKEGVICWDVNCKPELHHLGRERTGSGEPGRRIKLATGSICTS